MLLWSLTCIDLHVLTTYGVLEKIEHADLSVFIVSVVLPDDQAGEKGIQCVNIDYK